MTIFTQPFFALMGCHFMAFAFSTAGHSITPFFRFQCVKSKLLHKPSQTLSFLLIFEIHSWFFPFTDTVLSDSLYVLFCYSKVQIWGFCFFVLVLIILITPLPWQVLQTIRPLPAQARHGSGDPNGSFPDPLQWVHTSYFLPWHCGHFFICIPLPAAIIVEPNLRPQNAALG